MNLLLGALFLRYRDMLDIALFSRASDLLRSMKLEPTDISGQGQ